MEDGGRITLLDLPQQGHFVFVHDRETEEVKMMGTLRRGGIDHFANGDRMIWLELR